MNPKTFKYFAYGSNMCSGRLRTRVKGEFVATAELLGHQLRFHKLSQDSSSKCNAFHTGDETHMILGVVYDIPESDKAKLDRVEGVGSGYEDREVTVTLPNGEQLSARTYIATPDYIREGLAPYSWYKTWVEGGATEHELPQQYIADDLSPNFHPLISRVPVTFEPNGLGGATGRSAEPSA